MLLRNLEKTSGNHGLSLCMTCGQTVGKSVGGAMVGHVTGRDRSISGKAESPADVILRGKMFHICLPVNLISPCTPGQGAQKFTPPTREDGRKCTFRHRFPLGTCARRVSVEFQRPNALDDGIDGLGRRSQVAEYRRVTCQTNQLQCFGAWKLVFGHGHRWWIFRQVRLGSFGLTSGTGPFSDQYLHANSCRAKEKQEKKALRLAVRVAIHRECVAISTAQFASRWAENIGKTRGSHSLRNVRVAVFCLTLNPRLWNEWITWTHRLTGRSWVSPDSVSTSWIPPPNGWD